MFLHFQVVGSCPSTEFHVFLLLQTILPLFDDQSRQRCLPMTTRAGISMAFHQVVAQFWECFICCLSIFLKFLSDVHRWYDIYIMIYAYIYIVHTVQISSSLYVTTYIYIYINILVPERANEKSRGAANCFASWAATTLRSALRYGICASWESQK